MIITLNADCSEEQKAAIIQFVKDYRYSPTPVTTQDHSYLVAIGSGDIDLRRVGHLQGVKDVHRVSDVYKLVSRKWKANPTVILFDEEVSIREGGLSLIAGPCSVEDEDQIERIAIHLKEQGVRLMRGGAFKPRTSPYSFSGHGMEGLKMFHRVAHKHGLRIVSEVVAASHIEAMYNYIDVFQVGARNSQNFELLRELGQVDRPVLLKRGMSGTIDELLQSAEYIFSHGNERLILCERGIRTFETATRNTLDLNAIPVLKEKSHLPVIVDPSHGIGVRRWVEAMALAGIMAGADGVIFEVHHTPEQAASDGQQTLNFEESTALIRKARKVFGTRLALD